MALLPTNANRHPCRYGVAAFADPTDYERAFRRARVRLTVTGGGDFKARLTRLHFRHLWVLDGREELPRIAYVSLPPSRCFVSFPTREAPLIWDGVELRPGEVVFHSRGERMQQRTVGRVRWGLVSLPPKLLASIGQSRIGQKLTAPLVGCVLKPAPKAASRLLRLHSKACRLAEIK